MVRDLIDLWLPGTFVTNYRVFLNLTDRCNAIFIIITSWLLINKFLMNDNMGKYYILSIKDEISFFLNIYERKSCGINKLYMNVHANWQIKINN